MNPCVWSYSIMLKIAKSVVTICIFVKRCSKCCCYLMQQTAEVVHHCNLLLIFICSPAQLPPGASDGMFTSADTWPTLVMIDRKYWFISPPHTLMGSHSSFFLSHNRGMKYELWYYAFLQRWGMKNADCVWFLLLQRFVINKCGCYNIRDAS